MLHHVEIYVSNLSKSVEFWGWLLPELGYEQYQKFRYRRIVWGGNIICGWLNPLDKKNKTFLDLYFGLGLRKKEAKIPGEPRSIYRRNNGILINDVNNVMPSLPAGLRLLIRLK